MVDLNGGRVVGESGSVAGPGDQPVIAGGDVSMTGSVGDPGRAGSRGETRAPSDRGEGGHRWLAVRTLVYRYREDESAPSLGAAGRDFVVRALLPAVVLFVVGLGIGWVLSGPIGTSLAENRLSEAVQAGRTPTLDAIARVASAIGSVAGNAITCVLAIAMIWVISRKWWLAALPALALWLHVQIHLATSTLIARPRPDVETLDVGQPTASFPSGHMGATTAQLLVVVLFLCQVLAGRASRAVIIAVVTGYLLVLGWSRVYLGMHHVSDVVWGAVNGVACALIAWLCLRRNPGGSRTG